MKTLRGLAVGVATVLLLGGSFVVGNWSNANAVEILDQSDSMLDLEINKGRLVRLDAPASTVFVADPEIADVQIKSPRLIYVFGRKVGETTLFAVDANENVLLNMTLEVSHNLSRLRASLDRLLPGNAVQISSIDGGLVLDGAVKSAVDAENARQLAERFAPLEFELINRLNVIEPNQVHLRVRVAEVSRSVIKQFGINWDAVTQGGSFLFGLATGNPVTALPGLTAGLPATAPVGTFFGRNAGPRGTQTNSAFGSFSNGSVDINGLIDALDEEGLIAVLAEPNLTAKSGETASFLAGGEFPIPVPQDNGRITIEFKKFGVGLAFTPTVVGNNISLKVRPEVSQISTTGAIQIQGFVIPALTTRRAETTVELASGQSFAIAGLLQNSSTHDISKFPGLGDVPVLGGLFRSDGFVSEESELVIVVTPYLVEPVSSGRIALPTDGLTNPSDLERLRDGKMYKPGLAPLPVAGREPGSGDTGLLGPVGFIID